MKKDVIIIRVNDIKKQLIEKTNIDNDFMLSSVAKRIAIKLFNEFVKNDVMYDTIFNEKIDDGVKRLEKTKEKCKGCSKNFKK